MPIAQGPLRPVAIPLAWEVDAKASLLFDMGLYFSAAQVPELAGLTKPQRQAVIQCALQAFYCDDLSRLWFGAPWILAGIIGGAMIGWGMIYLMGLSHPKLLIPLCGLIGAAMAIFFAGQVHTARLRPYLQRVVEERKDEIAQIS